VELERVMHTSETDWTPDFVFNSRCPRSSPDSQYVHYSSQRDLLNMGKTKWTRVLKSVVKKDKGDGKQERSGNQLSITGSLVHSVG